MDCLNYAFKISAISIEFSKDEVVRTLLSAIDKKALPHLLFYGPPGTGEPKKKEEKLDLYDDSLGPSHDLPAT